MRNLFFGAVLALILVRPAVAAPDPAPQRLDVILDWFVNANHEALLSAQYSGAYARHGLDVHFIAPTDPASPPRLLAAHQADLCIGYQVQLPLLAEGGLDLVRVGTLENTPLNTLIVAADGPIHTLADLKGKRIGASVGAADEALLKGMLESAGLKPGDVTVTDVNFQLEQALMTHRVDAIMGAMRNYELIDLEQRGFKARAFFPEEHGVPLYDELIVLARRDELKDPRIPRFMAALQEGTIALLNHPDAMWDAFVHDHPELDTKLNHAAWTASLPRQDSEPALLDVARYREFQDFMVKQGTLKAVLPVDRIAVQPTP